MPNSSWSSYEPQTTANSLGRSGELILADVLTLNGYDLRAANPALVVASPPCQRYSYMAMPFSRGKRLAAWYRGQITSRVHADGSDTLEPVESSEDRKRFASERQAQLNALYRACFRIAAQLGVPIVLENVKGAQPWVGKAKWHYGSYYLWGDVPALMPQGFNVTAAQRYREQEGRKGPGGDWFENGRQGQDACAAGIKQEGLSGPAWFDGGMASKSSRSGSRKAASALIAEIPYDLAHWIARVFKPSARAPALQFPAKSTGHRPEGDAGRPERCATLPRRVTPPLT